MNLSEILGVRSAADLDPNLPLSLGPLTLGPEATTEAIRILEEESPSKAVQLKLRAFQTPTYWLIEHATEGVGELFGFPQGVTGGLPTAIELAIVSAVAASEPDQQSAILSGGMEIILGSSSACKGFQKLYAVVQTPLAGNSLLVEQATRATVREDVEERLTSVVLNCLSNSFRTSPLKFRFIELYRSLEARFISDVKLKLLASFDAEPATALTEALAALKSEMNQMLGLARSDPDAFERCWSVLDALKNKNRFVTALFRKVEGKGVKVEGRAELGAALIYQMRCAIVHAGGKEIIFESFTDGDEAVAALIPDIERVALRLVGIEVA